MRLSAAIPGLMRSGGSGPAAGRPRREYLKAVVLALVIAWAFELLSYEGEISDADKYRWRHPARHGGLHCGGLSEPAGQTVPRVIPPVTGGLHCGCPRRWREEPPPHRPGPCLTGTRLRRDRHGAVGRAASLELTTTCPLCAAPISPRQFSRPPYEVVEDCRVYFGWHAIAITTRRFARGADGACSTAANA
jgi:hypothetical protein